MGEKITKQLWDKFSQENDIKHFKFSEFVKPENFENGFIDSELVLKVEKLRELFGKPLIIFSGYRTPEKNEEVGGAPRSYHLKGQAVDISITEFKSSELYELVRLSFEVGFNGIILYPYHIHLDIREDKKVFIISDYKKKH
jgi:uncharacterized protein YcbK (DUF882 family)